MFFWIDSIVDKIQYGQRTKLCGDLKLKSQDEQFAYFVDLAKKNTVQEYGSFYLKNETFALQVILSKNLEWTRFSIMDVSKLY